MFTKHNNKPRSNQSKPRCNHPSIKIVPNVRCNHSPLAGGSKLQGNFGEGAIKNFINSNAQLNPNSFTPSQNFLAENFTLPQGEGDCTEFRGEVPLGEGDDTELDKADCNECKTYNKSKNSYSQKKLQFAKNLRHNQTDAEGLLWYYIRSKQLGGFRFKRQQIIGKYIVDFVCFEKKLIIELDGSQHGEIDIIKSDKIRDDFLKYRGFKILRFWNEEIFKNCFEVLNFIYHQLRR